LLIRKFDKGKLFTVDDEVFEKLSVEIKKFKVGVPINLGSPDLTIYYSNGGSAFIYKGHGVYSTQGSGTLTIREVEKERIVADIDFSIVAEPAGVFPFEEKRIRIKDSFAFVKIGIGDLTPWLGLPNSDPGREVYP